MSGGRFLNTRRKLVGTLQVLRFTLSQDPGEMDGDPLVLGWKSGKWLRYIESWILGLSASTKIPMSKLK